MRLIITLFASLILWACGTPLDHKLLREHVILADRNGRLVEPESRASLSDAETEAYVDAILTQAASECETHCVENPNEPQVKKLLVHIHGGLNTYGAALDRAQTIAGKLDKEIPAEWHYPVFVAWPSGGISSYGEHAVDIRVGRDEWWGWPTAPIMVTTDIATGVVKSPYTLTLQFIVDIFAGANIAFDWQLADETLNVKAIQALMAGDSPPSRVQIAEGEYSRGFFTQASRLLIYLGFLPVKAVTAAVVLDGMGSGAWEIMLRRTHNMFRPPSTYDASDLRDDPVALRKNLQRDSDGAMAVFMRQLADRIDKAPGEYEITLVAHSMGAIIANRALWAYADAGLPIKDIIYMAPACSIVEAEQMLVPYLEKNRDCKFSLLTLHPIAEVDECNFLDLVPRGSLLEWIHRWYAPPSNQGDRRLGTWESALQALAIFNPVQDQVSIKAFGVDGGSMPQKHGEFNECPFWTREFRDPNSKRLY
ncbi:MAG: lipase family protein [Planctomycetota bacterium]|jgi:pimeloyl-ACP methyl ester carboxylesterase